MAVFPEKEKVPSEDRRAQNRYSQMHNQSGD